MAESILTRRTKVELEYILLADIIVDTATTTIDITGLNIGKDEEVVLVSNIYNPTASSSVYRMFVNGNTTLTNYYHQYLNVDSAAVSSTRTNATEFSFLQASNSSSPVSKIKLTNNGYFVVQTSDTRRIGTASIILHNDCITSTFTLTSITQLTLKATVANAIGVGSRFQLYKIGGAD